MRVRKDFVIGFFIAILLLSAWALPKAAQAQSTVGVTCANGQVSPCGEDPALLVGPNNNACNACHTVEIIGANRDGSDRFITSAVADTNGGGRHILDPLPGSTGDTYSFGLTWTAIVKAMIGKGSAASADSAFVIGYLSTNYCATCTGPILASPVLTKGSITSTGATVTWATSAVNYADEPSTGKLYYGTDPTTMSNVAAQGGSGLIGPVTGCTGPPACQVATDPNTLSSGCVATATCKHTIALTGLLNFKTYYIVNESMGTLLTNGKTTRSLYTRSFTTARGGSGVPAQAYLSNNQTGSQTIAVIDPSTNTEVISLSGPPPPIPVKSAPGDSVAHPNGKTVYVMVGTDLAAVDISSNTVQNPSTCGSTLCGVGGYFNHIVISSDGTRLYVASRQITGSATLNINIIDTTNSSAPSLLTKLPISNPLFSGCFAPLGLGISPDGSTLYLACRPAVTTMQDKFFVININNTNSPPTLTITQPVTTFNRDNANMVFINAMAVMPPPSGTPTPIPPGTVTPVYLARTSIAGSTVEVFNGSTGAHTATIPLPASAQPRAGVFKPDGSRLYVADQQLGTHVIDTSSNTRLLTMDPAHSRGFDIAITPDGGRLYVPLLYQVFVLETGANTWVTTITGDFTSAYQVTMSPGAAAVDVTVSQVTPNASTVNAGTTLSVTDTVKNIGKSTAVGPFIVAYDLSPTPNYNDPNSIQLTATRTISSLAAGASNTATTNLAIPASVVSGNYYVCAFADATSVLIESNTQNNTLCSSAITVPLPDLTISSPAATQVASGGLFVLNSVTNIGGGATAKTFDVAFHLSTDRVYGNSDDIALPTVRQITGLSAGSNTINSALVAIPSTTPVGSYYICTLVNSTNTVVESNYTNNTSCTTSTYTLRLADLAFYNFLSANISQTSIIITDVQQNLGDVSSGPFTVSFYLSPNVTPNPATDSLIGSRSISDLAAGLINFNRATTTFTVPTSAPEGNYYVTGLTNSGKTVIESNYNNDAIAVEGTFTIGPDLTVYILSATISGGNIIITDTERNIGNQPAGPFTVSFYFSSSESPNPATDTLIGTRSLSGLAGGSATNTASTTFAIPASIPAGYYYVTAITNSGNTVKETNTSNNTKSTNNTFKLP